MHTSAKKAKRRIADARIIVEVCALSRKDWSKVQLTILQLVGVIDCCEELPSHPIRRLWVRYGYQLVHAGWYL